MKNTIRYSLLFILTIASIHIEAGEKQEKKKYISPFRWPATQVMIQTLAGSWDNSENPHIDPREPALPPKKEEIVSCIYKNIKKRRTSYIENEKRWLTYTDPSDILSNDSYVKGAYALFAENVAEKTAPTIAIAARLESMLSDIDEHTLSKKDYPVHTRCSLLEGLKFDCLSCAFPDGLYDYTLEKSHAYGIYDKEAPYLKDIKPFAETKKSEVQQ